MLLLGTWISLQLRHGAGDHLPFELQIVHQVVEHTIRGPPAIGAAPRGQTRQTRNNSPSSSRFMAVPSEDRSRGQRDSAYLIRAAG